MNAGRGTTNPSAGLPDESLSAADHAALAETLEGVRATGQTRWIAQVVPCDRLDPLTCYALAETRDRFLWLREETSVARVAVGVADEVESAGPDRFRAVRSWMLDVKSRLDWIGAPRPPQQGTFFGGFGFEATSRGAAEWKSFPAARFILPEVLFEEDEGGARWVRVARVEAASTLDSVEEDLRARARLCRVLSEENGLPSEAEPTSALVSGAPSEWPQGPEYRVQSDRSHDVFRAQVRGALESIEAGGLTKLVLARSLAVDHDGRLDVPDFLGRLRSMYPTCTLIAMGRGDDTFLAATPETLVRVSGDAVETAALAGSAPRGRNPDEDHAIATALQSDVKEREEHRHVVDAIRDVLASECEDLEVPPAPALRALFGIQHLETPIRGRLTRGPEDESERADVLRLVERLHPTPAVGGVPKGPAGDWLVSREGLDRGWYASPMGWLDGEGGGDFSVALRSALIRNGLGALGVSGSSRALLFAGAGIVAGSDPKQELVETRIKLRALLAPLTEI